MAALKKTYSVNSPCIVAGKLVKTGTVTCEHKDAAPLIETGSLKESDTSEVTLEVFTIAVEKLDKENPKHWTAAGQPDLKVLDAANLKVTAKERDALWAQYNA